MADPQAVARLLESVDRWNQWKLALPESQRIQIDLKGAELEGAHLRGANLQHASMHSSQLVLADLRDANLIGAVLYRADLFRADLRGADLTGADLTEANLRGANVEGADFRTAILTGATMTGMQWDGSTLWPEGFEPPESSSGPPPSIPPRRRQTSPFPPRRSRITQTPLPLTTGTVEAQLDDSTSHVEVATGDTISAVESSSIVRRVALGPRVARLDDLERRQFVAGTVEGLLKIADDWLADPPRDAGADNVADVLSLSSALGNVMRGSEPDPMLIERMTGLLTAALALHVDIEAAAQQFSESVGGPDPVQDLATLQWVLINQDIGLPDEPGDYEAAQDFVDDLRNVTEVLTAPVLDHVKSHDERIEEELRKIRALIEKQPGRFATLTYGFVSAEASLALHSSGLLGTLGRLAIRLLIGLHIP